MVLKKRNLSLILYYYQTFIALNLSFIKGTLMCNSTKMVDELLGPGTEKGLSTTENTRGILRPRRLCIGVEVEFKLLLKEAVDGGMHTCH